MDEDAQATGVHAGGQGHSEGCVCVYVSVLFPAFMSLECPRAGKNSAPDTNFLGVSVMF